MSLDVVYKTPVRKDICVVYCYYNPLNDPVILKNALSLEAKLKESSTPYFNAEVLYKDNPAALMNPTLTVSAKSLLYYKESVWNLIENHVPDSFTKVFFMDVNLRYSRLDWLDSSSLMLNFYDVIQPYSDINYLDVSGSIINSLSGAVRDETVKGVQGDAWAIKRSFFKKIGGFLDKGVLVPGLFYSAISNPDVSIQIPLVDSDYKKYASIVKAAGCKLRYLNVHVNSLYNGAAFSVGVPSDTQWNSVFSLNSSGLWEHVSVVALNEIPVIAPSAHDTPLDEQMKPAVNPVSEPVAKVEPVVEPVAKVEPVVEPVVKVEPVVVQPRNYFQVPVLPEQRQVIARHVNPAAKNNAARAAAAALVASFRKK